MTKKISQREVLRLRKQVKELETKLERYNDTLRWGWGTPIDSWTMTELAFARVKTAILLGHAVIIKPTNSGTGVEVKAVKYV